jgi:hypothetical protein
VRDAIIAGRIAMQQMAELAEIEVLRQHIPATEIGLAPLSWRGEVLGSGYLV